MLSIIKGIQNQPLGATRSVECAHSIKEKVKIADSNHWTIAEINRKQLVKLNVKHHLHGLRHIKNDDFEPGAKQIL